MKHLAIITILGCLMTCSSPALSQTSEQIAEYEQRIAEQQQQLDQLRLELDELKGAVAEQLAAEPAKEADERKLPGPFVYRKNENLELQFSGRLHRMLLTVDDGANTDLFFTDSEQGPTMLRFDVNGKVSDSTKIGGTIETGIRQNRPFKVSQDVPDGGTDVTVRIAEVFFDHSGIGKFSLGRGFSAGWFAPEMDLSGTQFASLLPVGMLAPGMKFVDASDNSLSDIQVLTHFADVERLLLVDRARYDSPQFGPGLQLSGSLAHDSRWDIALRAKPRKTENWTLVGGISFQDKPFSGIDRRQDAVVSLLHNDSGLNFTVGGVNEKLDSGGDAKTYLIKVGWLADLVSLGKTAFSLDYYEVSDLQLEGDEGQSIGLFAVQKWPAYGIDFYAGFRRYELRRPDIDLKDLDLLTLGIALNF